MDRDTNPPGENTLSVGHNGLAGGKRLNRLALWTQVNETLA